MPVDGNRTPRPLAVAFRALQLGDLLVAVPALRALLRGLPEHRLLLATSAWLEPVVGLIDAVEGLVPIRALGEPLPFAPGEIDVVANLHGGGPESAGVVDAATARLTVRHAIRPGEPGPVWVEDLHERERWVRLTDAFGMPGDPDDVRIARPAVPSPAPGAAVVHVGAASRSREWPADRFAAVARTLAADGTRVVLSGSAGERARAARVAALAGLPDAAVLAGTTDLAGFVALIADASLVVTADTGAGHLASAFATPSVVLFGPVPPARWGPPPGPHIALTHPELLVGDAFADRPDPALTGVTAAEVLAAVARLRELSPR